MRLNFQSFYIVALSLALAPLTVEAGSVFKCKSADGTTSYQQTPCQGNTQLHKWNTPTPAPAKAIARETEDTLPNAKIALTNPKPTPTLVIPKSQGGGYWVTGILNGISQNMLVDTGASHTAISQAVATAAGIRCTESSYSQTATTTLATCKGTLDTLTIGPFTLKNVPVTVFPNINNTLLGQSVLHEFRLEQDRGSLRLSWSQ